MSRRAQRRVGAAQGATNVGADYLQRLHADAYFERMGRPAIRCPAQGPSRSRPGRLRDPRQEFDKGRSASILDTGDQTSIPIIPRAELGRPISKHALSEVRRVDIGLRISFNRLIRWWKPT